MMLRLLKHRVRVTATWLACFSLLLPTAAFPQQSNAGYTFKAQAELVLVNVSVRDAKGNLVRDLKPDDFTVLEDNKPQKIASFDIENTENIPRLPVEQVNLMSDPAKRGRRNPESNPQLAA
jgi:hypothetical protein